MTWATAVIIKTDSIYIMCDKNEDDFELYTVKEFHEAIEKSFWWCVHFENGKNKIETDIFRVIVNYLLISVNND